MSSAEVWRRHDKVTGGAIFNPAAPSVASVPSARPGAQRLDLRAWSSLRSRYIRELIGGRRLVTYWPGWPLSAGVSRAGELADDLGEPGRLVQGDQRVAVCYLDQLPASVEVGQALAVRGRR
jgi:hypothetical protein